jgi:cation diffusion facilitator family transporter
MIAEKLRAEKGSKRDPALQAALILLACNVLLFLLKGFAGIMGNSAALTADAANSLGDAFTIVLVYFGLRLAVQPRDDRHPYGHGRVEDIIANLMGVVLVLFGGYLLYYSISGIVRGDIVKPELITVWVASANVVIKEAMYKFTKSQARTLRSPALSAVAADFRTDVLVSIGILAGILAAVLRWPLLDPLVSIPVSLAVVYMGVNLYRSSVHALMDGMPDEDTITKAVRIAEGVPRVGQVHDVKGRYSGRNILLDMKIEIDPALTVDEGHDIAHQVQEALLKGMPEISSIHIHVNPSPHSHLDKNQ